MTKLAEPSTPSGSVENSTTKATDHALQKYDNFTRYGQRWVLKQGRRCGGRTSPSDPGEDAAEEHPRHEAKDCVARSAGSRSDPGPIEDGHCQRREPQEPGRQGPVLARNVSCGSFASVLLCPLYVRSPPDSDRTAVVTTCLK